MRPHGCAKTLERRRKKALAFLKKGMTTAEVAKRVGTSFVSVYRWERSVAENGLRALDAKPVPGRPRKLPESEYERLWDILLAGAMAYGFPNDLWTLKRIASVIHREFGVAYHPNYVWEILRREGWSCQVPERRAIQRDEAAIATWKQQKWPAIKKNEKTWCPSRLH